MIYLKKTNSFVYVNSDHKIIICDEQAYCYIICNCSSLAGTIKLIVNENQDTLLAFDDFK